MKSKKTLIIAFLSLLILAGVIALWYFKFYNSQSSKKDVEQLDTIKNFDYKLEDRDTELFKNEFNLLKDILSKEEIDYSKYAEEVAKLYIIDLYTINNKLNVYDVGSLEYIYPDIKENFELKVKDTLYKYIENDTGSREQSLPEVSKIQIDEITEDSIIYKEKTLSSYNVKLTWEYVEDLGYDQSAELILVRDENKVYVLEQK